MITVHKKLLSGTAEDIRQTVEDLARGEGLRQYVEGTWFRELAVHLATRDGLAVSLVSYDDSLACELEVILTSAPHCDAIVIDRSQPGDQCQITLDRWLPISDEPAIKKAATTIHAILDASAHSGQARTTSTPAGT
jgi:hypothetical protein